MGKITHNSRTLKYVRSLGWEIDRAERWVPNPGMPGGGFRKDVFGFIDFIALGENSIIAVQSCGADFAAHHRKVTQDPTVAQKALKWAQCGGRIMLIGWRKIKIKKGGKAMRWSPRIKEYDIFDF